MTAVLDSTLEDHLEALHFAIDYIPKRALRFMMDGSEDKIAALLGEMEAVLETPEVYREEGTCILYYGMMILASLHREEGIPLIRRIGLLSSDLLDEFLGDRFFDSFTLAIAELYKYAPQDLKPLIEDASIDAALRAASLQAMMILYGHKVLTRSDIVSYFKSLLETRKEKLPYFYDVIAGASFALHPEEMMEPLRAAYNEGFIDTQQIQLKEIEEIFSLPKEQVVEESRDMFAADLKDLIAHFESANRGIESPERNDPCPCGSGLKYKKCCI